MHDPNSDFPTNPRDLAMNDRRAWCQRMAHAQQSWLPRLARLVEPPAPQRDFPAFLLDLPPFAELHQRIGEATRREQLPPVVADELQHFVDAYRDYLRSNAGELVFATARPKA